MGSLRKLIREEYTQVAPGDPAPLGRIAFSPMRRDDVPTDEADTPEEFVLYKRLKSYVMANTRLSDEGAAQLRDMIRAGNYPKIFKEPKVPIVYRGMHVGVDWLSECLGLPREEIPDSGEKEGDFTYAHFRGAGSSWSVSKDSAYSFARYTNRYSVVIHARTAENRLKFLDMNDGLYNVKPMNLMSSEEECLGLGPIKVFKMEWIKMGDE
jgi:hypothetical protein